MKTFVSSAKAYDRGIVESVSWYRPPNSPPERFNELENVIDKIDAENKELYILGDVNCNLLPEASAHNSSYLKDIFDIYGLS